MEYKNTNPLLALERLNKLEHTATTKLLTFKGTLRKTFFCLLLALASASVVWFKYGSLLDSLVKYKHLNKAELAAWRAMIVLGVTCSLLAFLVSFASMFKKSLSYIWAPSYALLEGIVLSFVTIMMEFSMIRAGLAPGIGWQAFLATMSVVSTVLFIHMAGLFRATAYVRRFTYTTLLAVVGFYGFSTLLSLFGIHGPANTVTYLNSSSSLIGIGFSLFIIALTVLLLFSDLATIEEREQRVPKYMEWYFALSMFVTIAWMYLEILKLIAKLSGRRKR